MIYLCIGYWINMCFWLVCSVYATTRRLENKCFVDLCKSCRAFYASHATHKNQHSTHQLPLLQQSPASTSAKAWERPSQQPFGGFHPSLASIAYFHHQILACPHPVLERLLNNSLWDLERSLRLLREEETTSPPPHSDHAVIIICPFLWKQYFSRYHSETKAATGNIYCASGFHWRKT